MKTLNCVLAFCLASFVAQAGITLSSWSSIYKGIELASGQAVPDGTVVRLQEVRAFRIDLHDPDIQFFTTPRNTNGTSETLGQNTSLFLKTYGLQVANNPNPRTAAGISQDGHYLIMMTIDGRQSGWSDGAVDSETADWLIRLGSYNGVNLDGGGSTAMIKSDCDGSPIQVNRPIDAGIPGHERVIANNFGVYAKPLPYFVSNVVAFPYDTTATITWQTPTP